jgi:ChrR Cupin-like domain
MANFANSGQSAGYTLGSLRMGLAQFQQREWSGRHEPFWMEHSWGGKRQSSSAGQKRERTMAAEISNPSQIIEVAEIAWESITPTINAKMVWSDPTTNRRAQLTRFEPGASLSMHRHVGDELLYVIEGSISDESGTVSAGSVG